jgi:hypothetical protein
MDLECGNISAPIICILDMYSFLDTIILSETSDLAPEIHSLPIRLKQTGAICGVVVIFGGYVPSKYALVPEASQRGDILNPCRLCPWIVPFTSFVIPQLQAGQINRPRIFPENLHPSILRGDITLVEVIYM